MEFSNVFIEAYRPLDHPADGQTLRGWMTVRLPKYGFDIRGIAYHENAAGDQWVEMPYRLRRKQNGDLKIYTIRFLDSADWRSFRGAVIDALNEYLGGMTTCTHSP